jgi:hypothetical protein
MAHFSKIIQNLHLFIDICIAFSYYLLIRGLTKVCVSVQNIRALEIIFETGGIDLHILQRVFRGMKCDLLEVWRACP